MSDPAVQVVHVTSPNHVHAEHVRAVLRAGKHVVCEKPLGTSSTETGELVAMAADAGVVNAVCFNLRYYPQNQNAAALVATGAIGEPRFVTGRYHQDWLLLDTDWNWRLDASRQGGLRAVADIGSHWLDLTRFVSGRAVVEVLADLHTFVTERNHPLGEVQTFGAARWPMTSSECTSTMDSDDAAGVLLRYEDGWRGRVHGEPGLGRAQEHRGVGGRRIRSCAGVGVRGSRAPLDGPPRATERDHREGRRAHDGGRDRCGGLPGGSRRGISRHVPGVVRRRVPRRR